MSSEHPSLAPLKPLTVQIAESQKTLRFEEELVHVAVEAVQKHMDKLVANVADEQNMNVSVTALIADFRSTLTLLQAVQASLDQARRSLDVKNQNVELEREVLTKLKMKLETL